MDRRRLMNAVRRHARLAVTVTAVATMVAGVTLAVLPRGEGTHRAAGILPPGSMGSLSSPHAWWDPRGWLGGDSQLPKPHRITIIHRPARPPVPRQAVAPKPRRVRELAKRRTANARVYKLSDGRLQADISAAPVNYADPRGQWQPIDTTVMPSTRPGYKYANTSNTFRSFFGTDPSRLVRFQVPGGGWLAMGLDGAHAARPRVKGDTVTYPEVAPGAGLSYQVTPAALKENITLASASAASPFSFTVKVGGGLVPYQRAGQIVFSRTGVGGPPVLVMPRPFMTDARRDRWSPLGVSWSPKVSQRVQWDPGAQTLQVTVTPDAKWLNQPARRFPVVIDPTINIAPPPGQAAPSTVISSDTPATPYPPASWPLQVGTTPTGAVRSLLQFTLPTWNWIPAGTQIDSADLRLYRDQSFGASPASQTIEVHQATRAWDSSSTWNSTHNPSDITSATSSGQAVVNPSQANRWDSFPVRSIVQSWLDTPGTNFGLVVKTADESVLGKGGPQYERAVDAYGGVTANDPQLVITYGRAAVTLNPITTIRGTGADLSWTPYVDPTPTSDPTDDLVEYQVHRSALQTFNPHNLNLVAPVPAGAPTTYTDTSATPSPASGSPSVIYYMVTAKTKDGKLVAGPTQKVILPKAGFTTQVIDASGATTLSQAQPTTAEQHLAGQPWLAAGDNSATYGVTRTVLSFPSLASQQIPSTAVVTGAQLRMWGWSNTNTGGGPATYEAHALTRDVDPAAATWNNAAAGTPWATPGGDFTAAAEASRTGLTNDPALDQWPVVSAVQGWVTTPASQHGFLVKLAAESSGSPQEQELFLDTTAAEPALRPQLRVTYLNATTEDTYYVPALPDDMTSDTPYTVSVTVTNTTGATLTAGNWKLSYHWMLPDRQTEISTPSNQLQTALPADLPPGETVTLDAQLKTPDISGTGNVRGAYILGWDLFNTATNSWLSGSNPGIPSIPPLSQPTSVTKPGPALLGLEKYYQYTGMSTGSGSALLNNDATGNVVWSYNAFSNPSVGFATFVRLAYNSMDTSNSSMGFGWSLQASTLMRLGRRPGSTAVHEPGQRRLLPDRAEHRDAAAASGPPRAPRADPMPRHSTVCWYPRP